MDTGKPNVLERLSQWDTPSSPALCLAALDDEMEKSVKALEDCATSFPPIPRALPLDDVPDLIPDASSLDFSSSSLSTQLRSFKLLDEDTRPRRLESAEAFLGWMAAEVETAMAGTTDAELDAFGRFLTEREDECVQVTSRVDGSLDHLERLSSEYHRVSDETNQLHAACQQLLSDQSKLGGLVETLDNELSYFTELDRIAPRLANDSLLTVTSESFVPMLARIDECVAYLEAHPRYREAPLYLAKFRSCLSRALTLIRGYVVSSLESATRHVLETTRAAVSANEVGVNAGTANAFTLFYGRFRTRAPRIKALMEQLELRQNANDANPQYTQLLSDCHQCYVAQRQLLLGPSVSESIRLLSEKHSRDHCTLVRSGCAFLVHMCQDEYQLFFNFFSEKPPLFDAFLESLCLTLYDLLRPMIIHINHLETLAELCSILKVEMMEQPNESLVSSSSSVSGFSDIHSISGAGSVFGSGIVSGANSLKPFATIAKQLLEDVQERLVYRAHVYCQSDVLGFNPAPGDLAYPDRLIMMRDIAESLEEKRTRSEEDGASETGETTSTNKASRRTSALSPADLHGMWYPTVRRSLVTLSKLYRCVDKTIFQGLSQELLSACIKSLVTASLDISARKTQFDGRLFLVKHLLILREQIAPFQVDFLVKETSLDFSVVKSAAVTLYRSRSNIFQFSGNNALLKFLLEGTPQVKEQLIDSRKNVDWQLKKTCEEFIHLAVSSCVAPIRQFLEKATYFVTPRNENQSSLGSEISSPVDDYPLRQQPFATPEKLHDIVGETNKLLRSKLPKILNSMSLYLANKDTESILFKPIKVGIQEAYRDFRKILHDHYRGSSKAAPSVESASGDADAAIAAPNPPSIPQEEDEDIKIVACPEAEQLNLMLSSIMAAAASSAGPVYVATKNVGRSRSVDAVGAAAVDVKH